MKIKNVYLKIMIAVISLLILSSITAATIAEAKEGKGEDILNTAIEKAVVKGVLSREKADSLFGYFKDFKDKDKDKDNEKNPEKEERNEKRRKLPFPHMLLEKAVDDGVITSSEAEAIIDIAKQEQDEEMFKMVENAINNLVDDNTLTRKQADKIIKGMKAEKDKLSKMSEEERDGYYKTKRESKEKPFGEFVKDGTLTEEQADKVLKALIPLFARYKTPKK